MTMIFTELWSLQAFSKVMHVHCYSVVSRVGTATIVGMQMVERCRKATHIPTDLGFMFVPAITIAAVFSMPEHMSTKIGGFALYSKAALRMSGMLTVVIVCYLWWLVCLSSELTSFGHQPSVRDD
jgi:uncharacterized protein YjeT (DUF2065 family)